MWFNILLVLPEKDNTVSRVEAANGDSFLADKRDLCFNEVISFCLRKGTKRLAAWWLFFLANKHDKMALKLRIRIHNASWSIRRKISPHEKTWQNYSFIYCKIILLTKALYKNMVKKNFIEVFGKTSVTFYLDQDPPVHKRLDPDPPINHVDPKQC
jgi:hypothetical protein